MFLYRVAGLTLAVPDPLPLPQVGPAQPDLTVAWHGCPDECSAPSGTPSAPPPAATGVDWLVARTDGPAASYTFPGLGAVVLHRPSGAVTLHPAPGTAPHTMWHLLLDQVLPLELAERGELVLHAASVAVPTPSGERAVLFLGESGAGKSTTALACALAGARHLGDDFARVAHVDGAAPRVFPADLGVRLWQDSADAVPESAPTEAVAHYTAKIRAFLDPATAPADPVPIAALAVLGERLPAGAEPVVTPLPLAEAFAEVLRQAFRLDVPPPHARARAMDQAARLVEGVGAVVGVRLPESLDDLARTGAALLAALAERVVSPPRGGG